LGSLFDFSMNSHYLWHQNYYKSQRLYMQVIDETTIQLLKNKSGLRFNQTKDYLDLAKLITEETGQNISENTLRRLMGQTPNSSDARTTTLNAIARYLGFISWDTLQNFDHGSGFRNMLNAVCASDLAIGQHLEIIYPVNRLLRIRLVRENIFLVEESTSNNLRTNDELFINTVIEGQALFVTHVYRNGEDIGQYIAGEVGGVTSIRVY